MKKLFYLFFFVLFAVNSQAAIKTADANGNIQSIQMQEKNTAQPMGHFSKVTKHESKKKMGFFKKMKLKMLQKFLNKKSKSAEISKGLYILLSIFWLGWLAMGILDDWEGNNWIIGLLLYVIFYLPGLIFSLIKMSEYY